MGTTRIVSATLGKEFSELGWQYFQGTFVHFHHLRTELTKTNPERKKIYAGPEGYAHFCREKAIRKMGRRNIDDSDVDMFVPFRNASAVLGSEEIMKAKEINWKKLQGNYQQYHDLICLFEEAKDYRRTEGIEWTDAFQGTNGQKFVTDLIFGGNTRVTYHNVSILRERFFGDDQWLTTRFSWENGRF